jgi:hypothetical protein
MHVGHQVFELRSNIMLGVFFAWLDKRLTGLITPTMPLSKHAPGAEQ